jgi:hypothetical protein
MLGCGRQSNRDSFLYEANYLPLLYARIVAQSQSLSSGAPGISDDGVPDFERTDQFCTNF